MSANEDRGKALEELNSQLRDAAKDGNLSLCRELLDQDADPNDPDESGFVLHSASDSLSVFFSVSFSLSLSLSVSVSLSLSLSVCLFLCLFLSLSLRVCVYVCVYVFVTISV